MTNAEKYKTSKERIEAFRVWCEIHHSANYAPQAFNWLDLEAEKEKLLPCPFCGKDVYPYKAEVGYCVSCDYCGYVAGGSGYTEESAIASHNRVARAVAKNTCSSNNQKPKENQNG